MIYGDRSRYRKLAVEAAVVCCLVALCYAWARGYVLALGFLGAGAILALIGLALRDGPPRAEVFGDFEDGGHGAVQDGRVESGALPDPSARSRPAG
jgi:hypothetical protein